MNGTALVRRPSSRLAEGILTHIGRSPVDVGVARAQHVAYAGALAASGWMIREVPAADDCPDSVFIEDTVVICADLAVLTRPGAPARRAEVAGVAEAVRSLGLRTACMAIITWIKRTCHRQAGRAENERKRRLQSLRSAPW